MIVFFSIKNFKNSIIFDKKLISLTFLQFFFVVLSFFGLIFSFINSDFSNETVFNHSHTTIPLFYKVSGAWGNHEGSLLLWLLVLTLFIFIFLLRTRKQIKNYNSVAYTTLINHQKCDNRIAYQIFTKFGPIAFLPCSNKETSIVFSMFKKNKNIKEEEILMTQKK